MQVARAIRAVTGEDPGPMSPLHGFGHYEYFATLRTNSTTAACHARLSAAQRTLALTLTRICPRRRCCTSGSYVLARRINE